MWQSSEMRFLIWEISRGLSTSSPHVERRSVSGWCCIEQRVGLGEEGLGDGKRRAERVRKSAVSSPRTQSLIIHSPTLPSPLPLTPQL